MRVLNLYANYGYKSFWVKCGKRFGFTGHGTIRLTHVTVTASHRQNRRCLQYVRVPTAHLPLDR